MQPVSNSKITTIWIIFICKVRNKNNHLVNLKYQK